MSDAINSPPTLDAVLAQREEILKIARHYGAMNVRIFGSVVRGEATPQSDIDFLVDLPDDFSLLMLSGFVQDLQEVLGYRVQVTSAKHLREAYRASIAEDVQAL
jgi:hypothetical protein